MQDYFGSSQFRLCGKTTVPYQGFLDKRLLNIAAALVKKDKTSQNGVWEKGEETIVFNPENILVILTANEDDGKRGVLIVERAGSVALYDYGNGDWVKRLMLEAAKAYLLSEDEAKAIIADYEQQNKRLRKATRSSRATQSSKNRHQAGKGRR